MQKQKEIVSMFDSIARKYDLVNRVLSFGIDKKWRKEAIRKSFEFINKQNIKILDVACGTGDMIKNWIKFSDTFNKDIEAKGLDPSREMLNIAKEKLPDIEFIQGFATEIPFENETFDIISISFGIRNVLETQKAIDEFFRTLKPNGILLILEFTKTDKKNRLRNCVDFYTEKFSPVIGGILSKNKDAYKYLPNSIQNFYTKDELCNMMKNSGFEIKKVKNFNFGQVSMLIAQKP